MIIIMSSFYRAVLVSLLFEIMNCGNLLSCRVFTKSTPTDKQLAADNIHHPHHTKYPLPQSNASYCLPNSPYCSQGNSQDSPKS